VKLLEDVDVDEVSPVRRAANRRRFILKEGADPDAQIQDIMAVPAAFEGAMLDDLRAHGADETVQKAAVAAVRLLEGVEDELPDGMRETIRKLGSEMYPVRNPPLNSTTTDPNDPENELIGHASEDGSLPTWKADADPDSDEDDDVAKAFAEKSEVRKRTYSADERKRMAANGQAMPGGRYPIPDKDALNDAIDAVGRGKGSHATIRAHIRNRAKALGATGMLPDSYKVSKEDEEETLVRRVLKAMRKPQDTETTPADENGETSVPNDDPDDDTVSKSDDKEGGTVETPAVPVLKEDGTWDLDGVPDEQRATLEPVFKAQEAMLTELKDTRERLEKSEQALAEKQFIAKAKDELPALAAASRLGPVLKAAHEHLDEETFGELEAILKAANEQVETGDLFKELGRAALTDESQTGDAWSEIEKAADALIEKDSEGLTREQAIDKVMKTAEGRKLYSRYQTETYHLGARNLTGTRGEAS
jgi:hypothetical protein